MLGEAAGPALPARAARARRRGRHGRPGARHGRRPRLRPPARRLAAHRPTGHRPPPGPVAARPGPRRARGAGAGLPRRRSRSRWPGRGRSPPPSRSRAATRCCPTTVPGASSRRPWPRASPTHLADVRRRVDAERVVVQVDEPALPGRARRDRSRPRPASAGTGRVHPPEASEALGWVLERAGRRTLGALVRGATPRGGCCASAGARGLSGDLSVLGADDLDALAEALEAGETGRARRRPVDRPATRSRRRRPSPSACCDWLDMLGLDPDAVVRPAGHHPRVRARRSLARVGAPGHRAVPRGGAQPVVDVARWRRRDTT